MVKIKIVNSEQEIHAGQGWTDVPLQQKQVEYGGRTYRVVSEKERYLSGCTRIGRCLLGILAFLFSAGLALISNSCRRLFTAKKEQAQFVVLMSQNPAVLRLPSKFPKTSSQIEKKHLGLLNPTTTIPEELEAALKNISVVIKNPEGPLTSFTLTEFPGLIFKTHISTENNAYNHDVDVASKVMHEARTILSQNQLNLLVIPNSRLITIQKRRWIIEEKLDVNLHEDAQEQYYQSCAGQLNEAIEQLTKFICMAGFTNARWNRIPVLNGSPDEKGNRRVALFDLKIGEDKALGLIRLIECVSLNQGKLVVDTAKGLGRNISINPKLQQMLIDRSVENKNLQKFYDSHNIVYGDEKLVPDENDLVFEGEKKEMLRDLGIKLIQTINDKIADGSPEDSIKKQRFIYINTNHLPYSSAMQPMKPGPYKTIEERQALTPLPIVIKKLIDCGLLHSANLNGHGYYLQA